MCVNGRCLRAVPYKTLIDLVCVYVLFLSERPVSCVGRVFPGTVTEIHYRFRQHHFSRFFEVEHDSLIWLHRDMKTAVLAERFAVPVVCIGVDVDRHAVLETRCIQIHGVVDHNGFRGGIFRCHRGGNAFYVGDHIINCGVDLRLLHRDHDHIFRRSFILDFILGTLADKYGCCRGRLVTKTHLVTLNPADKIVAGHLFRSVAGQVGIKVEIAAGAKRVDLRRKITLAVVALRDLTRDDTVIDRVSEHRQIVVIRCRADFGELDHIAVLHDAVFLIANLGDALIGDGAVLYTGGFLNEVAIDRLLRGRLLSGHGLQDLHGNRTPVAGIFLRGWIAVHIDPVTGRSAPDLGTVTVLYFKIDSRRGAVRYKRCVVVGVRAGFVLGGHKNVVPVILGYFRCLRVKFHANYVLLCALIQVDHCGFRIEGGTHEDVTVDGILLRYERTVTNSRVPLTLVRRR